MPEPKDSTKSRSLYTLINSLFRGIEIPLKNSSLLNILGNSPAEVISILSGNISNFGGTISQKVGNRAVIQTDETKLFFEILHGESANAIKIQIWITLIANLLL